MSMLPLQRPDCQREQEAAWREQELAYDLSVLLRAARLALAAGEQGGTKLLVSAANARAAAVAGSVAAFGVRSLAAAVGVLSGQLAAEPTAAGIDEEFARLNAYDVDCADGRGQEFAKRALVVAASGGHNVLMMWTLLSFSQDRHILACPVSTGRSMRRSMGPERATLPPLAYRRCTSG